MRKRGRKPIYYNFLIQKKKKKKKKIIKKRYANKMVILMKRKRRRKNENIATVIPAAAKFMAVALVFKARRRLATAAGFSYSSSEAGSGRDETELGDEEPACTKLVSSA
jgi:hypothetical protein